MSLKFNIQTYLNFELKKHNDKNVNSSITKIQ